MTIEKMKAVIIGSEVKQTIYGRGPNEYDPTRTRYHTINLDFTTTKIAQILDRKAVYCYGIALCIDIPEYKECYSEKMGGYVSEFGWYDFYSINNKKLYCLLCTDYHKIDGKNVYVPVYLEDNECPLCGYKFDTEKLITVVKNTTWNP